VKPLPPLFIPDSADEARRLTREIGDFLGIPQHHWDEQIQDPSFEVARQLVHKQSDEVRAARRFGLEQPIEVRADPGADRLTLARRRGRGPVSGFVRFWGLTVALMGLFFLALPLIGGTFNGRADAFLEPILIGAAMLAAGLLIALLRRGTTIDRRDQTVSFWWGIPRPLWATRQDLSRYSAVRVGRRVEDDAIVGTVGLDGPDNPELVLHSSKDLMEVQSLAENIARFLNWPVQGNPA
jgi:hypothetical protein